MAQAPGEEQAVLATLKGLGIGYELVEIDPEYADTAQFCEKYGYAMEQSGNTIIVASKRGEKKFAACLVLGSDRLDVNQKVKSLMNVPRLSFASAEETEALTGMAVGGVTPFALPDGLPVYADQKLLSVERLILGSGSRSSKIIMSPGELTKLPTLQFVDGLSLAK